MKHRGGCLPNAQQELLICILLGTPETRPALWQQWKTRNELEKLDPGSLRLLPLLYRRLKEAGIPDVQLAPYRGVYRHYWYRNRLYLKNLGHVLSLLNQRRIKPLLLKGLPLALETYPDPAARPMMDMDLYIVPDKLHEAVACLSEAGWHPDQLPPQYPDARWLTAVKAIQLTHPDGIAIDLHGTVLSEIADPAFDAQMLANARPITVLDGNALSPHPTDLLFHTIAHGYRWNSLPPFRWIVDSAELLDRHRDELDMDRLVRTAEQFNLVRRIQCGMEQVNRYLENERLRETRSFFIAGYHIPLWERMEHRLKTSGQALPALAGNLLFDTWRWLRRHRHSRRFPEFFRFLKLRWRVDHSRELPVEAIRRIHRRINRKRKAPPR